MAVANRSAVVSLIEEISDDSILQEARSCEDEGYLGTLKACDQWLIDLTLQNRVYSVFIAEFVERLPAIFPVDI